MPLLALRMEFGIYSTPTLAFARNSLAPFLETYQLFLNFTYPDHIRTSETKNFQVKF